jgi:prepilin-type processing-associated H-X9-DG protein
MSNCSSNRGDAANNGVLVSDLRIPSGGNVVRYVNPVRFKDITDGTTKTFLLGESAHGLLVPGTERKKYPWWVGAHNNWHYSSRNVTYPINTSLDGMKHNDFGFGSSHPGGCHFAMADGSAHFIVENIPLRLLFALASRQANDLVGGGLSY